MDDDCEVEVDPRTEREENEVEEDSSEEEEDEWLVQSDRRQIEKGGETTSFMEWVRRHVPTARYPEWSTGAQRESQIKKEVERRRRRDDLDLEILTMCGEGMRCSL